MASQNSTNFSLATEVLISLILASTVILFTTVFEKPLSYNNGLGWDGSIYYHMANQISQQQPLVDEAPYVYRLGIPFLVGIFFPHNLIWGFKTANLIGSFLSIFLLLILLRKYIKNWVVRMVLMYFFVSQWLGPLRTTLFYPTQIEPWDNAIILLQFVFLFNLHENRSKLYLFLFALISFLGVIIRESTILVPFMYFVAGIAENSSTQDNIINRQKIQAWFLNLIPLFGGTCGYLFTHVIASPNNSYSILGIAILWAYQKPMPAYLYSYFVTLGPMIAIFYPARAVIKNFLINHQTEYYYLLSILILAWVIGSDTDRFLYWAMPVWYILFGLALEYIWPVLRKFWGLLLLLLLTQCISQRSFLPIPDYAPEKIEYRIPLLTVICNDGCTLDVSSYNGLTGSGINAALCSVIPCYFNKNIEPLKLYLLMENIFVTLLLLLGIVQAQKTMRKLQDQLIC